MMKTDFQKWVAYHCGAYPGFAKWINRPENERHVTFMERLLYGYTIDQLQAATDELFGADPQPKGFGDHARAIRALCNPDTNNTESSREGPKLVDGHLTALCSRCMDYGVVEVLSPQCLKELWSNEAEHLRTCIIACNCSLGDRKARVLKTKQRRMSQWEDGSALFPYEPILDEHVNSGEPEIDIARRQLLEYDGQRNQPQDLTGDVLL